jgi:hypothetical protein
MSLSMPDMVPDTRPARRSVLIAVSGAPISGPRHEAPAWGARSNLAQMSAGRRLGSTERGEAPEPASIGARFLELFALSGLAVAQPLLAVYADNSLELISRQVEGWSIVAFTLAVLLVPAAALLAVEQLVGLASRPWCERVHGVALAVLFGLFLLQIPPNGPAMGVVALVLGVGGGVGFWFARRRLAGLSTWLRFLAIAPVVFAVAFLLSGGIADLVLLDPPDAQASSLPEAPPSVLFLVLDELPTVSLLDDRGEIDASRFPAIAELASEGTWYPNHTTMASWTSLAVPGILTGQYPGAASNQAHWTTYPENLFTLLGESHDVIAHESATRLCPSTVCPSASRSAWTSLGDLTGSAGELWLDLVKPFDELEIDFSPAGVSVPKGEAREIALETVDELVANPDPTLAYLHLELPHQPWDFLPSGRTYDAPDPPEGRGEGSWSDAMAAASAGQRHLLQLEYTDAVVGAALDRLREGGRFDDTMVVLVADHGVAFTETDDQRAIGDGNLADIAFTPLIVKAPGQTEGTVDDRPVQTVDVLPTVADTVDIDIPWAVDGVSLGGDADLEDRERRYYPLWIDELPAGEGGFAVLPSTPLVDLLREADRPIGSAPRRDAVASPYLLAGRDVADLDVSDERAGRAVIVGGAAVEEIATDEGDAPAFVDVSLSGVEPGSDVTIAVDGTVVVTGRLGGADGLQLWATLPESALEPGTHELAVFVVTGEQDAPALAPVDVELR